MESPLRERLERTRLGAICTPFPVQYGRHELAGMGSRASMVAFVTATDALNRQPVDGVVGLHEQVPSLHTILAWGQRAGEGYELLETLERAEPSTAYREYIDSLVQDDNDCATLVWTSGTEGAPKGVPRAFGDWGVLGTACSEPAGLSRESVLLNPFPMVNGGGMAGMFVPWIQLGATLVQHHPFDLDVFVGQVRDEGVTYTCAPPAVLDALVARGTTTRPEDLATLRAVGSGSAPLAGWMIARWEDDWGIEVLNLFGSNEGGILFADPDTVPEASRRGRLFPLIIRGGYKISAAEIEGLVGADPRVREVAAVAMPDERLGERLCLFVVPEDAEAAPGLDDLIDLVAGQGVAKFKWPERLEIVSELPRSAVGKILKRQLRQQLATEAPSS